MILQGHRRKKLEARKIREAKEEEQRKAVDLEFIKYVADQRKEAIQLAKTKQYYQTDRVKGFHVRPIDYHSGTFYVIKNDYLTYSVKFTMCVLSPAYILVLLCL